MSLEYKILGQELVSYTVEEGTDNTTSYYVSYEETLAPLYVTVPSFGSTVAYSTDGITWAQSTLPSAGWRLVAYGGGKFVAVAFNSSTAYSTNGITWTASTMPSSSNWSSVAYGDGKFVAVSRSYDSAAYSTDGITWTASTLPSSFGWASVTYGDGKFVAVSISYDSAAYSTDGITWTASTLPSSSNWRSVTYGDGKFVAVSNSSSAAYSTDGITWTASTMPDNSWSLLSYGEGKFVAVDNLARTVYSIDGITWTESTMPTDFWFSATYGDGKFVAVAFNSPNVALSTDGITWTRSSTMPSNSWSSLSYGESIRLIETLNIIGGQGTSQTEEFLPRTIYTVPAGKQTTVTSVYVVNHDESESTYDFAVVPAGEELSLKHHIRWDMPVAGKDFEVISTKITMSAGDKLVIFPSTVDTVSVTAFGVEK